MTGDLVTYDPSSDTYHAEFSAEEPDDAADTVVAGVAAIEDEDPIELEPLGSVVDTDALGDIFHPASGSGTDVSVSFEYSGYRITVWPDESITFEPLS